MVQALHLPRVGPSSLLAQPVSMTQTHQLDSELYLTGANNKGLPLASLKQSTWRRQVAVAGRDGSEQHGVVYGNQGLLVSHVCSGVTWRRGHMKSHPCVTLASEAFYSLQSIVFTYFLVLLF